ncbi:hypothetical protein [Mycolicibacterium pulveris]|uniref:hypothetical protein n=1 Tax=Mycolicibacterium pulveris TaxID=36813 RepID=UPI003CE9D99F
MAVREIGSSPIVFGQATELYESLAAEFRSQGVNHGEDADSMIVIVDHELIDSIVADGHFRRARRQERASGNHICDLVTDTAISTGAQRLLVVCDMRHVRDGKQVRVVDWVRDLAHRISYECSVNGLQDLTTSIAVVRSDAEADRAARAVVDWYKGIRPAGGWF